MRHCSTEAWRRDNAAHGGAPSGLEATVSPFTLLRLLTGAATACGLVAVQGLPTRGLDGHEEATGEGGTLNALAADGTAALGPGTRPSSAARTRNTISVGFTRSMRTVPPLWGRSVAKPVAAS